MVSSSEEFVFDSVGSTDVSVNCAGVGVAHCTTLAFSDAFEWLACCTLVSVEVVGDGRLGYRFCLVCSSFYF